jgi:hypothetical protein
MPTTDRLDARARGGAPPRPRPSHPPRRRPLAAVILVVVLAIAWFALERSRSSSARGAPAPVAAEDPATAPAPDTSPLRALLRLDPSTCVDVVGDIPAVSCTVAGVHVDAKLVGLANEITAYVEATGARLGAAAGPPVCAHGHDEERSWSRPSAPAVAVGRYTCRLEHGAPAMWWTDDHGVLAYATTDTGDLAQLFAWWRAHLLG